MLRMIAGPVPQFLLCLAVTSAALAQPCERRWDATVGNPGLTAGGYVQPMCPWNDRTGEALFVGGSFDSIGGVGGTSKVGRWNRVTNTWSPLAQGVWRYYTNSFVTAIVPFNSGAGEHLYVGGFFDTASNVPGTSMLARWNGSAWSALPGGTPDWAVWAMAVYQGRLYIGGGFGNVGGVPASGIASWDGASWAACGTGIGGGSQPCVFTMGVFDDGSGEKLYVAGRFYSIGGVNGTIGRWNGKAWEPVGTGLFISSDYNSVVATAVFNDGTGPALYVGGDGFHPQGKPDTSVAKWNGSTWTNVGQNLGGRTEGLAAFDDGTGMALYNGGGWQPGVNYFTKLQGGQWVTVDGGVDNNIFGLAVWDDRLYVGGMFGSVGPTHAPASGLAARTACVPGDTNCDGVLNFGDIDPFVLALSGEAAYLAQYPNCYWLNADCNGDGNVDFGDIDPFVALLSG